MTRSRGIALITASALAAILPLGTGHASTPQTQSVTVPTAGGVTVTTTWTGTIPHGVNKTSRCDGTTPEDTHEIDLTVPTGVYSKVTAQFTFTIKWTPSTTNEKTSDEILTVSGPQGQVGSSDGSTTTEQVGATNLPAPKGSTVGKYIVRACGNLNVVDQPYTGTLVIKTKGTGSAPGCPISVAGFGHDLAAAQKALASVTSTCRTIVFPSGSYVFNDKFLIGVTSVNVTGEPGAVIQPAAGTTIRGGLLQIAADGVTISGLTISGSPRMGIEGNRATNFTISGNVIRNSSNLGIHLLRSSKGTVSNNTIYDNSSNGIDLHGSTYVVIKSNKVYHNGASRAVDPNEGNGIIAYCSQHIDILSNTIYNNSQGQPGGRDGIRLSDNAQQNGELPTRYVKVDGNLAYDNQTQGTQNYAVRIGGPSNTGSGADLNYITVTNNTGYGNLSAGIFTGGLAPGATFTQSNNDLKGR
jgi:parallel beta-helix repeat protein